MSSAKSRGYKVSVGKGKTRKEAYQRCIKSLDGLSNIIDKNDKVFIKCNLQLPNGFPTNTSFETLKHVIESCKSAGAAEIMVGDFPYDGISLKKMDDLLGIDNFLREIGASLAFLDNSQHFRSDDLEPEQLKLIKDREFKEITQNGETYLYPKVVLNADKLIVLNQVNVDPVFKVRYALASTISLISNEQQKVIHPKDDNEEYLQKDEYKRKLISKIIDVHSIKPPDLVINDCFYIMEGAGPYIYEKSKLKKTNLVMAGTNALSLDLVLLNLFGLEVFEHQLITECQENQLGPSDLSDIELLGAISEIEHNKIDIFPPVTRAELVNLINLSIKEGSLCSGCKKSLYHLLNLIDSVMIKDLKYIGKISLLAGQDPPTPDSHYADNHIIFGECALESTKEAEFRTIKSQKEKTPFLEVLKSKFISDYTPQTVVKEKVKENKKILELPGCPPNHLDVIQAIIEYFGKKEVPNLNLFKDMINSSIYEDKEQLKNWEDL